MAAAAHDVRSVVATTVVALILLVIGTATKQWLIRTAESGLFSVTVASAYPLFESGCTLDVCILAQACAAFCVISIAFTFFALVVVSAKPLGFGDFPNPRKNAVRLLVVATLSAFIAAGAFLGYFADDLGTFEVDSVTVSSRFGYSVFVFAAGGVVNIVSILLLKSQK